MCNYFRTRRAVAVWFFSTLCFSSEAFDGPIYFTRSYTGLARMRVCQCCSSVQSFFAPAAGQPFTSLAQEWLVASRCIGQSALRSCGGDALCKIFSRLRRANLSLPPRKWLSAHYGSSALQQCLKFVSRLRRTNFASRPQDGPVASRCLEQRVLRQWGGDVLRKIFLAPAASQSISRFTTLGRCAWWPGILMALAKWLCASGELTWSQKTLCGIQAFWKLSR